MTNKNYFHVGLVIDRSGSMSNIAGDMNGALDKFLKDLRQENPKKKILVDAVGFDNTAYSLYTNVDIDEADSKLVVPTGLTALLDGVGLQINTLGARFRTMPENERPSKVLVIVITDGLENASREWGLAKLKLAVTEQENKYGWSFVFLGANIDAFGVGNSMGFSKSSSANYVASPAGVRSAMASTTIYASSYFLGQEAVFTIPEEEDVDSSRA